MVVLLSKSLLAITFRIFVISIS